uniref:Uncharacterized protein n=1 Tax=Oscillatoriales cyanobacterium SpSt-402 TaxID=2282168 RepID=A0A832H3J5_9CYAN
MKEPLDPIELQEPLWERQSGESSEWYRRFCRVRNQIGARSVLAAYRQEFEEKGGKGRIPRRVPGSWERAREHFCWDERFAAWDVYQQEKEDQIWTDRLNELREKGWDLYELLSSKAEAMMRMPFVTQTITSSNGGNISTIMATEWNQFRVPLLMLKLAMELGYEAIGDNNKALTLLTRQGFQVVDPTANLDLSDYLEEGNELDLKIN